MNPQVWILAAGRLLSQIGTGFTRFYAAIFFVNHVGLSATVVGIALGSQAVSGMAGRFWGGVGSDSPRWGRKRVLLLSAGISALADLFLAAANELPLLLLGNILMGLGIGLYWPATEAVVADVTTDEQRNEAFAITRMADMVGISVGTVLAGQWIAWSGNYRLLFVLDGVSFVIFGLVIWLAIQETRPSDRATDNANTQWQRAFQDRTLMIYCAVNVLFTCAIAQIQSTLPLYLTNFVRSGGFAPTVLSAVVTFHVALGAVLQLPVARSLNRISRWQALMISLVFWGIGFLGILATGWAASGAIAWAILSYALFAIAVITYTPAASALVVDLAPTELRGIYLSLNSQCWAMGYFIGPLLGGWALDQSRFVADGLWPTGTVFTIIGFGVIAVLGQQQARIQRQMRSLVGQAAQACETQDAAGFASLFATDAVLHLPKQTIEGRGAIANITQAYLQSCDAITIEVQQVRALSDRVEVQWRWSEPHKVRVNQIELKVNHGLIQSWREF